MVIRTNGIPFDLTLNTPNYRTADAIAEGRRMVADLDGVRYHTRSTLIDALDS
jgi:antitoxin component of RelBE/YafQ-DinJ toxin-antitoxin module